MMKKIFFTLLTYLVMHGAQALELEGVKLADRVEVSGQSLLLNGAGVRKKMIFDVYIAALYLPNKSNEATQVLVAKGAKRLQLTMLRRVEGRALVQSLKDGLKDNISPTQYGAYAAKIAELEKILLASKEAKEGDVIVLDVLPGQGLKVQLQERPLGLIQGDEFARDLLQIWLGGKPVQADLKTKLLGG
ncbi:chalcone isomerase family protein [Chitinibacter sp. SCUT-21]|uniref:chalcone isomerase family protein n=1 Tax=Chitinibacter sp. SCUT-21 TaxID=2970891 RepID=UPI0035A625DF